MGMTSFVIDTHKAISFLIEKGYSKKQAEGFVNVLQSADLADVASRADVQSIKDNMREIDRNLQGVRVELYKVAAAQTIVIIGAVATLIQVL